MHLDPENEAHVRMMADLTKTAITRALKSVRLTTQLIDHEEDVSYVLMRVATIMVVASAHHLAHSSKERSEAEALAAVLVGVMDGVGAKRVKAALKPHKKRRGKK